MAKERVLREIDGRRRRRQSGRALRQVIEALEGRALLAAVPQLVADLNTLPNGSAPGQFVEFDGALYFTATADNYGRELWRTDGTRAGTRIVQDINPGGG